ncbi:MAG: FG-GAP repeat domain-containing protein, partial [Cellvibrionaceae bacterium]
MFSEADNKETARTEALRYFENTGSAFEEGSVEQFPLDLGLPEVFDSSNNVDLIASFVDYDADGDLDVFIGVDDGDLRYLRNEDGTYVAIVGENDPFDTVSFASNISPAFGDVDGDGDIDAFIGTTSELLFYQNEDGEMINMGPVALSGEDNDAAPALFDVDGDGDLDLTVGNKDGDIYYLENDGGMFTETMHPLSAIKTDDYIRLSFGDVDFDGDVDLVAGETNSRISVFAKDGDSYNEVPFNTLGLIIDGTESAPHFADFDGDGDHDLFIGDNTGKIHYFNNNAGTYEIVDGFDTFSEIEPEISDAKPVFVDYDVDGDLDVLVGSYGDPLQLF